MAIRDKRIVVPVTTPEHESILKTVEARGLDSVAAYIRGLIRADIKRAFSIKCPKGIEGPNGANQCFYKDGAACKLAGNVGICIWN